MNLLVSTITAAASQSPTTCFPATMDDLVGYLYSGLLDLSGCNYHALF